MRSMRSFWFWIPGRMASSAGHRRQPGRASCPVRGAAGSGWVDRVVMAPSDAATCSDLAAKWIGHSYPAHTLQRRTSGRRYWRVSRLARPPTCCRPIWMSSSRGATRRLRDYLADMVRALRSDPLAVTVAFNIAHATDQPYTAVGPQGPWRVESRIAMLHMQRLRASAPAGPGRYGSTAPAPAWHRALDGVVGRGLAHSLRGGDHRSFFIHPANERKRDPMALARDHGPRGDGVCAPSNSTRSTCWARWSNG